MSLQRATLRQLRIFEAAARHLHFGRAAAELHLSQPAVSIQLKQLERDVQLPLFEQMGRRMNLTRAGAELAAHARAVLARLREADDAIAGLKGVSAGELHIAATTTAVYFVPRLLATFRRDRPGLKVRLSVKNRELVVRDLTENTIDLAVMGTAPPDLDARSIAFAKNPLSIIAAPDHPLARNRRVHLAQLAEETFLIREGGSGTRTAMERAFAAHRFGPRETVEMGSNETIKQAVMVGMGVSFLSLHTAALELATGELAVLKVDGMPVMRDWCVIHRERKWLSPAAAAFKDYLVMEGVKLIDRAMRRGAFVRKAS
ncbi:MAG TPA: LysR substrate-binding domain-containing protein [Xanthobacteraceae bacterium]